MRLVGKPNYLTMTRPYIPFSVGVVNVFINSPCDSNWNDVVWKGHLGNDLFISREAIPTLLYIQIQIGKMMLLIEDQHQVIVF